MMSRIDFAAAGGILLFFGWCSVNAGVKSGGQESLRR
jgi:hypothetical protein